MAKMDEYTEKEVKNLANARTGRNADGELHDWSKDIAEAAKRRDAGKPADVSGKKFEQDIKTDPVDLGGGVKSTPISYTVSGRYENNSTAIITQVVVKDELFGENKTYKPSDTLKVKVGENGKLNGGSVEKMNGLVQEAQSGTSKSGFVEKVIGVFSTPVKLEPVSNEKAGKKSASISSPQADSDMGKALASVSPADAQMLASIGGRDGSNAGLPSGGRSNDVGATIT